MARSLAELRQAENFLHEKIPLTRAMGVRVPQQNDAGFTLEAPVALNYNHLHTAFGGSISAVATLAGYGFLWLELRDRDAEVVVAQSSIRYRAPIREVIRATCAAPDPRTLANFHSDFDSRRKARIHLHVRVEENELLAAEFAGVFVALKNNRSADKSAA